MFVGEKTRGFLQERVFLEALLPNSRVLREHVAIGLITVKGKGLEVLELGGVIMLRRLRPVGVDLGSVAVKDDFSGEFAFPFFEIFFFV